ncbi:uncharacterized protein PHACADRAFT_32029 [Phanerochaete carnosa HHB-10118-sp]|uniref:Homeobox domain-containing protein n=1 Tax=Phanerochaete carnosa (strain HHB-10118-sp) TaxID=650164 RepID=K5WL31_PHACS|nr:uncharacterized protein PHACADRAFT_32029 [Phanerochaete carnosa HHB-10118-sp]EKM50982.1 hypothetical protein PHACADRAFT_32029 [Phanerochaete carnosa HHB-10118-sp]
MRSNCEGPYSGTAVVKVLARAPSPRMFVPASGACQTLQTVFPPMLDCLVGRIPALDLAPSDIDGFVVDSQRTSSSSRGCIPVAGDPDPCIAFHFLYSRYVLSMRSSTAVRAGAASSTRPGIKSADGAVLIRVARLLIASSNLRKATPDVFFLYPSSSPSANMPSNRHVLPDALSAELEAAWQRDKRVPTLESRRAWAEVRNIDPEAVRLWFFRRRWKAIKREGEKIGKETYDLPADATRKHQRTVAPEPSASTKSVRVKRERAPSPTIGPPVRPAKKIKAEPAEPSPDAPRLTRHTRAHDARPHPDCLVCFPPKAASTRKDKSLKSPGKSQVIRHTRAHDSAPVPGCIGCFPRGRSAYTQPTPPIATVVRRATRAARCMRPSTPPLEHCFPSSDVEEEPLTPLSSGGEGLPLTNTKPKLDLDACTFSSSLELMQKFASDCTSLGPRTTTQGAYTPPPFSSASLASGPSSKNISHAARFVEHPTGLSDPVVISNVPCTSSSSAPSGPVTAVSARPIRSSSPVLPPRFKRKLVKTEPVDIPPLFSSKRAPVPGEDCAAPAVVNGTFPEPPAVIESAVSGSNLHLAPPTRCAKVVFTLEPQPAGELQNTASNPGPVHTGTVSSDSASALTSGFASTVSLMRSDTPPASFKSTDCSDVHLDVGRTTPVKTPIENGSEGTHSADADIARKPDENSENDHAPLPDVDVEHADCQELLVRGPLVNDILFNSAVHNTHRANCNDKTVSAPLNEENRRPTNDEATAPQCHQRHSHDFPNESRVRARLSLPTVVASSVSSRCVLTEADCLQSTPSLPTLARLFPLRPVSWTGPAKRADAAGGVSLSRPSARHPQPPPAIASSNSSRHQDVRRRTVSVPAVTTADSPNARPQELPPPHRPTGAPASRPNSPEPRRPPRPIRPGSDTTCAGGSGSKQAVHGEKMQDDTVENPAQPIIEEKEKLAAAPDTVVSAPVEEKTGNVVVPPAPVLAPLSAAAVGQTLRVTYSSEDGESLVSSVARYADVPSSEPLRGIAVRRKGKAAPDRSSSQRERKAAHGMLPNLSPSNPSSTLSWSADAPGETAADTEVAAPKAKPAVRKKRGKVAVDKKAAGDKNKHDTDAAPGDGGSADVHVGRKPKPKRPRKPRKKAQPPASPHAPALCVPDAEWQALWAGPSSLFPGPVPSLLGDERPADASRGRDASGASTSGPVLMHPPRQYAYDPGSLIAYQGCQWDANGFAGMELSALPWLASTRGNNNSECADGLLAAAINESYAVAAKIEADIDLGMETPSSDDSFLNFGLPADDPAWGSYLQLLPQQPTKLWVPFEDGVSGVARDTSPGREC